MDGKRLYVFYTLGCKLNFAESSWLARGLRERGYRHAESGERADLCVINTCTVTDSADRKSRQAIRRIVREHAGAFVAVVGCYSGLKDAEVRGIEGVDVVLGATDKWKLFDLLDGRDGGEDGGKVFALACSSEDRTRYFLKVQDGCDYFCSYCAVPYARGRSRNGDVKSLVAMAREVVNEGGREIVLTGVNIGDFGKSTGECLLDLLRALDGVEGVERFRVGSVEPNLLSDEVIDFVAHSQRFAPHFHIPLQSGSDRVLGLMRRRYDRSVFAHRVGLIKELMPEAFIGVDVIVGMRGEEAADFEDSRRFIEGLDVSELHVFPYSERAGTQALKIVPVVSAAEKRRRSEVLLAMSQQKLRGFYERQLGSRHRVLWEGVHRGGKMFGFTENYVRVAREYDAGRVNVVEDVVVGSDVELVFE